MKLFLIALAFTLGVSGTRMKRDDLDEQSDQTDQGGARLAKVITSCKKDKMVALTFDDGPHVYESDLVNVLNEYGAKGTFFVNGDNYHCIYDKAIRKTLQSTYEQGHLILSHTWAHKDLTKLNKQQILDQMTRLDTALVRILGVKPAYFRPPYGNYNNAVREMAYKNGQTVVYWDFDSGDADGVSSSESKKRYTKTLNSRPHNLLPLNHETTKTTVMQVIPSVLEQWTKAGYTFGSLMECLGLDDEDAYSYIGVPEEEKYETWKC